MLILYYASQFTSCFHGVEKRRGLFFLTCCNSVTKFSRNNVSESYALLFKLCVWISVTALLSFYGFLTVLSHFFSLNPLNAKLNPICHLLALLGAHRILHVSRIRVNLWSFVLLLDPSESFHEDSWRVRYKLLYKPNNEMSGPPMLFFSPR